MEKKDYFPSVWDWKRVYNLCRAKHLHPRKSFKWSSFGTLFLVTGFFNSTALSHLPLTWGFNRREKHTMSRSKERLTPPVSNKLDMRSNTQPFLWGFLPFLSFPLSLFFFHIKNVSKIFQFIFAFLFWMTLSSYWEFQNKN